MHEALLRRRVGDEVAACSDKNGSFAETTLPVLELERQIDLVSFQASRHAS
jgi:hypothetical protein